jgi:hypothetical protein
MRTLPLDEIAWGLEEGKEYVFGANTRPLRVVFEKYEIWDSRIIVAAFGNEGTLLTYDFKRDVYYNTLNSPLSTVE